MQNVKFFSIVFYLFLTSFIINSMSVNAIAGQIMIYEDYVFRDNIRTAQMHVKGWEMSYPVIELGSNEELIFSFDDLDGDVKDYQYRLIHCNADWTPSSLFATDYIDGFFENQLDNYNFSFNTFIRYTHYSLVLPNPDANLKLPGNYVIKVYEDYDEDKIVLTKRFMLSDSRVSINARVHKPQMHHYHSTGQQITISIMHPELVINDPRSELFVTVMQNGRQDNSVKSLTPLYIRAREIVYENNEKMVFHAGNEFRNFDTKSLRYQTEFIRNMDYFEGINHVELHPSPSRRYARYFNYHDINGRYLIRNEEGRNPSIDADYVKVYFTLPWDVPFDNGNVYVMGALSDWNFYHWNTMTYNYENKAYELTMLLKQGYYNYQFVFLEEGSSVADATLFEGNFFETENDYLILVYHRAPGSRFDRLVGTRQINSHQ